MHWEWMFVCRYPFMAGSRSGWAFSSAFRDSLQVCTTERYQCTATICTATEHTHRNCSMWIVAGAWAVWEGTAGWGSCRWGDGEQQPNLSRRITPMVLQVQGYFLITSRCPMAPSQALTMREHVPRLMNAWRRAQKCTGPNNPVQSGWRTVWGRGWVCTEQCFSRECSDYHRDASLMMAGGWRRLLSIPHPENSPCPLGSSLSVHRACWSLLVMKTQGLSTWNENNKAKRMPQCWLSSPWLFWAVADCLKEPHSVPGNQKLFMWEEKKNVPVKDWRFNNHKGKYAL